MSGFFSTLFGWDGNNGTEDAFKNSGGGQDFKEGEFNTGVRVAKGRSAPSGGNNGTKSAFNNSGSGKQDFGKAKFNTGARCVSMIIYGNSIMILELEPSLVCTVIP
ncbi:unnamed protein product [Sphenostylis stenocarpa]|uniref:Uncharacterized protein n=1 Tax=Sphenostylis stenocarpa TaxID=92480 RepID=A0AA86SBX5_9FABA|nr:unnamed protein product [Sphenostylis stenocarpa]